MELSRPFVIHGWQFFVVEDLLCIKGIFLLYDILKMPLQIDHMQFGCHFGLECLTTLHGPSQ